MYGYTLALPGWQCSACAPCPAARVTDGAGSLVIFRGDRPTCDRRGFVHTVLAAETPRSSTVGKPRPGVVCSLLACLQPVPASRSACPAAIGA